MTYVVDLTKMPTGARYEDRYGAYLKVFHDIALVPADTPVNVISPPASWWPLLAYLNANISGPLQVVFEHDELMKKMHDRVGTRLTRTLLEALCALRPELVDALWKLDNQWSCFRATIFPKQSEFVVTNNSSFFRQEVKDYETILKHYRPSKRKVVLVPCAADKPYPAMLHKAVQEVLPPDYYMANVTGVLGVVPQDLWPYMPHYDSGIPNRWRAMVAVGKYFSRHEHERVVVYSDFYNLAIAIGLEQVGVRAMFVTPLDEFYDYLPLHTETWISQLAEALKDEPPQDHGGSLAGVLGLMFDIHDEGR